MRVLNAQQNDGRPGFGVEAAQEGQNLKSVHAVQRGIQQDGLNAFVGRGKRLFHGGCLHHAIAVAAQLRGNPQSRSGVGVGQQHGAVAWFLVEDATRGFQRIQRIRMVGQEDAESGAADGIALSPDAARVLQDDGAANGQAQAAAAFLTRVRGVYLLEAAEDGLQLVGGDAPAMVDDGEGDAVDAGAQHDGDGRVRRRELDGVGEQIGEHLEQAVGVGGDLNLRGVADELHSGRLGHRRHAVDGLADDLRQLHGAEGQRFLAALNSFQIENVVDQPNQPV